MTASEIIRIYQPRKREWAWREPKTRVAYGPFMSRYDAERDAECYAESQRSLQKRNIIVQPN
jgi:hypothetical protein